MKAIPRACFVYDCTHKGNPGAEAQIFVSPLSYHPLPAAHKGPGTTGSESPALNRPSVDGDEQPQPQPTPKHGQGLQEVSSWPRAYVTRGSFAPANSGIAALSLNLADVASNPRTSRREGMNLRRFEQREGLSLTSHE